MEPRYFHHFIGGNFRLDEIQAAILNVKLPHLDEWSAARRSVADIYREEFTRRGLTSRSALPAEPYRASGLTNHHIYHQYVIRTSQRDALARTPDRTRQIGNAHLLSARLASAGMLRSSRLRRRRFPGNGTGCTRDSRPADLSRIDDAKRSSSSWMRSKTSSSGV